MSKTLSGKYYQENKDCKRYQNLSKEEKEKKVAIWSWMLQKSLRGWKTKNLVRTQKYIIEWEKSNNLEILKVYRKIDNIFILKTIYFILQNMFRSLHTSSSVVQIKSTVNIQIIRVCYNVTVSLKYNLKTFIWQFSSH